MSRLRLPVEVAVAVVVIVVAYLLFGLAALAMFGPPPEDEGLSDSEYRHLIERSQDAHDRALRAILTSRSGDRDPLVAAGDYAENLRTVAKIERIRERQAARAAAEAAAAEAAQEPSEPSGPSSGSVAPAGSVAASLPEPWRSLADCETGGTFNPAIVSSDGLYHGLFQFLDSTWAAVGGSGSASDAPVAEQLARAQTLQARSGWGQWPTCAAGF